MNKLLIVDDEPNIRSAYRRVFLDEEYVLEFAASGEEALRKAREFGPDIILLDIMLPGIDGYEVCKQIMANARTDNTEIIFISAKGSLPDRLKGYHLRAVDFIVKPFDPAELRAKVAARLERRRFYTDLASTDPLTGLGNRRFFEAQLESAYREWRTSHAEFSLAIIDVDRFKSINDTYGHDAGDHVLVEVSKRLNQGIRSSDLAARIGGDEFAILMPGTGSAPAVSVLQRLRERVGNSPYTMPKTRRRLAVTVSIGVASCPSDASEVDRLFKQADSALYVAKEKKDAREKVSTPKECKEG